MRPVFSFLYFLNFLVKINQNLIFKILDYMIFKSFFHIFYYFFIIHNGSPLKRYNLIQKTHFLAFSKLLRNSTENFRKIKLYNAKARYEDHILVEVEDNCLWLYNNFFNLKIYEIINKINFCETNSFLLIDE